MLFRAETFTQALAFYSALGGFATGSGMPFNVPHFLTRDVVLAVTAGVILSWPVVPWLNTLRSRIQPRLAGSVGAIFHAVYSSLKVVVMLAVFFVSVMSISSGAYNPFIYFRF